MTNQAHGMRDPALFRRRGVLFFSRDVISNSDLEPDPSLSLAPAPVPKLWHFRGLVRLTLFGRGRDAGFSFLRPPLFLMFFSFINPPFLRGCQVQKK